MDAGHGLLWLQDWEGVVVARLRRRPATSILEAAIIVVQECAAVR